MGTIRSPSASNIVRLRKNRVFPMKLNRNVLNHLYQDSTNNGRTGHQLTSLNARSTNLRTVYNVTRGRKSVKRGVAKLGSGKQGVVFLGCPTPSCKEKIVIKVSPTDRTIHGKQIPEVEFGIQKKIFKVVPAHIAVPYAIDKSTDFIPTSSYSSPNTRVYDYHQQYITFSEYCPGGDFDDWLTKVQSRVRDKDMAAMIFQIISALNKIHGKYPEFRHNDLHLRNILVDDTGKFPRLVISDFGLARLTSHGSNPIVNSGEFASFGITSTTDVRYDTHLFLNALRIHLLRSGFHLRETMAFLDRAVPPGYRGNNDVYVRESRLVGRNFPGLPGFAQLLADPFLAAANKKFRSPTRPISSPRIRNFMNVMPYSEPVRKPTSPRTPSRVPSGNGAGGSGNGAGGSRNAADIARNMLANMKGVTVTSGASRPSAAEFLRMSPRSRAAFMTGPRARNESRTVMVRNVTKGKGPNRERMTARRVPTGAARRMVVTGKGRSLVTAPKPAPMNIAMLRRENLGLGPRRSPVRPKSRSPARSPLLRARVNAGTLLNLYSKTHNARTTTKRILKAHLTNRGYAPESAKREVAKWLPKWETSRRNVNEATRLAKIGVNINARGYAANVAAIAKRRSTLKLAKSPGGRVRKNKALLLSKTKPELVQLARAAGTKTNGTKQEIVNALFG
jgi:serine/threonine protein kinase